MSQAKVDQYKKAKANRKETMAREKRQKFIAKVCVTSVLVVIAAWFTISIADFVYESRPKDTVYVQTTELDKYLEGLDKEESTEK